MDQDAIYVVSDDAIVYEQNKSVLMIPASLTKLATTYMAIQRWGLDYAFPTEFYREGDRLWVKGYGDPFLTSEELQRLSLALKKNPLGWVRSIAIDDSYFASVLVPGRSKVVDPYNAPLSAVAVNFNTINLRNSDGAIVSAEPQTVLTTTAKALAKQLQRPTRGEKER